MQLNLHTTHTGTKRSTYPKRINPVIFSPTLVFHYSVIRRTESSITIDRINVRRLFLTIESVIESTSRSQLFEFNDDLTRTNFVNIVDPYLRDVLAKEVFRRRSYM